MSVNVRILVLLTPLWLVACAAAGGAGELPKWKPMLGVGNTPCGIYLQQVRANPAAREAYTQWLLGYISALNAEARNINDVLGINDLNVVDVADPRDQSPQHWLDNYCTEHPGAPFYVAARGLITDKIYLMRYRELRDQQRDMRERLRRPHGQD